MTELEIRDRVDKWLGVRFASYPEEMIKSIGLVMEMNPDDRARFVETLYAFFCVHCGSDDLPCHCQNDE